MKFWGRGDKSQHQPQTNTDSTNSGDEVIPTQTPKKSGQNAPDAVTSGNNYQDNDPEIIVSATPSASTQGAINLHAKRTEIREESDGAKTTVIEEVNFPTTREYLSADTKAILDGMRSTSTTTPSSLTSAREDNTRLLPQPASQNGSTSDTPNSDSADSHNNLRRPSSSGNE